MGCRRIPQHERPDRMDSACGVEEGGAASEEEGTVRPIRTGKSGRGRPLIGANVWFGILTPEPRRKIVASWHSKGCEIMGFHRNSKR